MLRLLHLYNTAPSISSQGFEKIYQAEPQSISSLKKGRCLLTSDRLSVNTVQQRTEPPRAAGLHTIPRPQPVGSIRTLRHGRHWDSEGNGTPACQDGGKKSDKPGRYCVYRNYRIKSSTTQYRLRSVVNTTVTRPRCEVSAVTGTSCPLCETASR